MGKAITPGDQARYSAVFGVFRGRGVGVFFTAALVSGFLAVVFPAAADASDAMAVFTACLN